MTEESNETAEHRCARALRRLENMVEKAERAHEIAERDLQCAKERVIETRATLLAMRAARDSTVVEGR